MWNYEKAVRGYRCIENETKAGSLAVVKARGRKRFLYLNVIKVTRREFPIGEE